MKFLRAVAITLLTAGLLYLFFRNIHFGQVWAIIRRVHPGYLLLFSLGLLLQQLFRGYRWGILLRPRKAAIRVSTLVNFTLIGFLINTLLPGRIGEPARGILVARKEGINSAHGLASVVLERLIDALVVIFIFLVSLLFLKQSTFAFIGKLRWAAWTMLPFVLTAFVLFYFLNKPGGQAWISRRIARLVMILPAHRREQAADSVLHFVQGLRLQLRTPDFVRLTLSSFAIWLCVVPVYWLMFRPLGIQATLLEALTYYCILVAAASIPTPGMAGSLDYASLVALVGILGVDRNHAQAYTLIMHALLILVLVVAGFIALTVEGVHLKGIRRIREKT